MAKQFDNEQKAKSLNELARIMDAAFRIPGTNISFGLDALMGLIPGLGDGAGILVSSFIIVRAAALGIPKAVLTRMVINVLIDFIIGAIPLVGDIFDVAWKANLKNVELINQYTKTPQPVQRGSLLFIAGVFFLVVLIFAVFVASGVLIIESFQGPSLHDNPFQ